MCVVSMIADHYLDKWAPYYPKYPIDPWPLPQPYWPINPYLPATPNTTPAPPAITDEEIKEFRELLRRAREYDKKHNQPDCDNKEKFDKLKQLAKDLGVDLGTL